MEYLFDVIIVFIILFSVYRGYKKGIVNVGIKLLSIIVSLLVSMVFCGPITNFVVDNTEIDEKIEKIIVENLSSNTENNISNENNEISLFIQNYTKNIVQETQNTLVQSASKSISLSLIKAGVMIIIFILVRILFIILQVFTDVLTKIPIIKQCNEFGGVIYSLLKALLIIYIILTILVYISSLYGNMEIINIIEKTFITKAIVNFLLIY